MKKITIELDTLTTALLIHFMSKHTQEMNENDHIGGDTKSIIENSGVDWKQFREELSEHMMYDNEDQIKKLDDVSDYAFMALVKDKLTQQVESQL